MIVEMHLFLLMQSMFQIEYLLDLTLTFLWCITGDLAEAVLIQGTERGSTTISIGTAGNWNSSEARRHFMLHNRLNIEMTDPEIRGDIDGFVLGSSISSLLSSYSSLKLSTVLDMYYSPMVHKWQPLQLFSISPHQ